MTEDDTTFNERLNSGRAHRHPRGGDVSIGATSKKKPCLYPGCSDPSEPLADYCDDHPGGMSVPAGRLGQAPRTPLFDDRDRDDELEALRRDVAELKGMVNALLSALEVEVGDG